MKIDITLLSPERRNRVADIMGEQLADMIRSSAIRRDAGLESQEECRIVERQIEALSAEIERISK